MIETSATALYRCAPGSMQCGVNLPVPSHRRLLLWQASQACGHSEWKWGGRSGGGGHTLLSRFLFGPLTKATEICSFSGLFRWSLGASRGAECGVSLVAESGGLYMASGGEAIKAGGGVE